MGGSHKHKRHKKSIAQYFLNFYFFFYRNVCLCTIMTGNAFRLIHFKADRRPTRQERELMI